MIDVDVECAVNTVKNFCVGCMPGWTINMFALAIVGVGYIMVCIDYMFMLATCFVLAVYCMDLHGLQGMLNCKALISIFTLIRNMIRRTLQKPVWLHGTFTHDCTIVP